ncbi:MAG: branched-chain amino acid ABC transporter permease [Anaerolineae bacterium]|nr:branched-chain amino acid ABC transporter permease [Anaerolineae bacterium]
MAFELKDWLQFLVSGFSTGCIYALIGLGIIVIYSVTRVINMAQGEFVMLGAMLAVVFSRSLGLPLAVSFMMAVAATALIGVAIFRLTIVPARRSSEVTQLLITIGTAMGVRGVALTVWGTTPRPLPAFTAGAPLLIGGAALSLQRVWIIGATAMALLALYAFFEFTLLGKALRACSVNRKAAELSGVPAGAMGALAYGVSAALGALAGIVIAPLTLASYDMGLSLGLKGFVVAVMGGFVSAPAAVLSGVFLGVLESVAAGIFSAGFKDALAFLVLFLVLLVRTAGLPTLPWRRARAGA